MGEPLVTGVVGGSTGGTVAVDYEKTADASVLINKSGLIIKDLLDKIAAEYTKNVNSENVWQSKAAENALAKFTELKNKFSALHDKIVMYSAGVKYVADTYKEQEQAQFKEAEENLNGTATV
jgi:hypothetical protein